MPTLPTLTVSQEHYNRIVAAFPGTTDAEKAASYNAWLVNRLIDRVYTVEAARLDHQATLAKASALEALMGSLPPRANEPAIS